MLLGLNLDALPRLKLGEADGGLAGDPLVFLLAEKRLEQGLADHLAGVVIEARRNFRIHGVFQLGCQGNVHGIRLRELTIFVKPDGESNPGIIGSFTARPNVGSKFACFLLELAKDGGFLWRMRRRKPFLQPLGLGGIELENAAMPGVRRECDVVHHLPIPQVG